MQIGLFCEGMRSNFRYSQLILKKILVIVTLGKNVVPVRS